MPSKKSKKNTKVAALVQAHFAPAPLDGLTITERMFPYRVRADLQRAIDGFFGEGQEVLRFCGVQQSYSPEGIDIANLVTPNRHEPALASPPRYQEVDIGEDHPVRCLHVGLWFLQRGPTKYLVLLAPDGERPFVKGLKFQIATLDDEAGTRLTQELFDHLERTVHEAKSYRGKILSLEEENRYSGMSAELIVHTLRSVAREDVILPRRTLELLERNVLGFARQRKRLAELGLSTKKGLLFYGPPGTGKTHTIHFLARELEGHTTLLVSAEQVGLLGEYMTLARLLQPSVVVLEDVDLIARDRREMGVCEEVLLNKLLNEMDGLKPDADVLFVLTTNRPESLESALASRPGRIDQAIEFPLPDEEGRAKLVRLYACGLTVGDDLVRSIVDRTENVSASFIKELMRRAAQFQFERGAPNSDLALEDIEHALEELLFTGGSLNRKLLGASANGEGSCSLS